MARPKNSPTVAALNAQIAALQAQAEALRRKEVADVVAKAKVAIARYGLTPADFGFGGSAAPRSKTGTAAGRAPTKRRGKAAAKTAKTADPANASASRPVKFRDDNGNTWGGMGKRPEWFKAALQAGKSPGDLLVRK